MGPENPDPYVFYIADARTDVKPQNWEFVNPLSPGTVTADIKTRWDARMGTVGSGYSIGQKVTKNMAPYWEVSLRNTSIPDLLQFDMLFITNHRNTRFAPAEREKLRKLVDAGGIVWIEDCGGLRVDAANPFFKERPREAAEVVSAFSSTVNAVAPIADRVRAKLAAAAKARRSEENAARPKRTRARPRNP